MGAAKDLEPGECYLEVPSTLVINRKTVLKSPVGVLIDRHPELFEDSDVDDPALILFYFYEKLQGEKSFYWPLISITNVSDLP